MYLRIPGVIDDNQIVAWDELRTQAALATSTDKRFHTRTYTSVFDLIDRHCLHTDMNNPLFTTKTTSAQMSAAIRESYMHVLRTRTNQIVAFNDNPQVEVSDNNTELPSTSTAITQCNHDKRNRNCPNNACKSCCLAMSNRVRCSEHQRPPRRSNVTSTPTEPVPVLCTHEPINAENNECINNCTCRECCFGCK